MSRAPTFAAASVATAGSVGLGRFRARVVQYPGLASAARKCGKMRPVPHRPAQHPDDRAVGVTAGVSEVVIATKLFRPNPRHQTVERTRLHDLLRQGCTLPLTLVVAPAGWGKSTLVADWLRQDRVAAGWVSLDGGDDDPKRFWRYLLLAAGQAMPAAGAAARRRLDAAGSDVLRDVLPTFVNEMASSASPLVLVLDDYHLVTSAQVHALVTTLLDRCPPQLHLVLITRADPPLQLSRLRVRGELAELRAEPLKFSLDEAREFFGDRLGTQLSEQDVHRLLART